MDKPIVPWPPLVRSERVPLIVWIRDLALTFLAWAILMYFMKDLWVLLYDFIINFFLKMSLSTPVDWKLIWNNIAPFVYAATLLVFWIVLLGSLRRRAIRSTGLIHGKQSFRTVQQQFPLKQIGIDMLSQRFGVNKTQLEQWQAMRDVNVTVDEETGVKTIVEVR